MFGLGVALGRLPSQVGLHPLQGEMLAQQEHII